MSFLNQNAGAIQAAFAVVVGLSAAWYAYLTARILREMHAARVGEAAPYVIAHLDITEDHVVYIVVKNIGRLPARDVKFAFEPPLVTVGLPTKELPAFVENGIPFLPPNYEMRSILGMSFSFFAEGNKVPKEYRAHITYVDATTHATHVDNYILDLGAFANTRPGTSTMMEIRNVLRELRDEVKALGDRRKG